MSKDENSSPPRPKKARTDSMMLKHKFISVRHLLTAFRFYQMMQQSPHLSSKATNTWEEPLLFIYNKLQNYDMLLNTKTCIAYKQILDILKTTTFADEAHKLQRQWGDKSTTSEIKKRRIELVLIYFTILAEEKFRTECNVLLAPTLQTNLELTQMAVSTTHCAKTPQLILTFPDNKCIECDADLELSYTNRTNSKSPDSNTGVGCIIYCRRDSPQCGLLYKKKCPECKIDYYHSSIHYPSTYKDRRKAGRIVYLDPRHFAYWNASHQCKSVLHFDMYTSIFNSMICNKPQSMQMWLEHYNEDFSADYNCI